MIQITILAYVILVIFIVQIIIEFVVLAYWKRKFITEARKIEFTAYLLKKPKIKSIILVWALLFDIFWILRGPIPILLTLLFIIDGTIFRMGILYSPYLSFFNPFDMHLQILGVVMILLGIVIFLITGKMVIKHVYSKATEERKMITTGLYAYIRHPHYLSFFLIPLGFFLLTLNVLSLFYFMAFFIFSDGDIGEYGQEGKLTFIIKAARREEEGLKRIYGKDYEKYMEKTGMIIPKFRK
jgi:protein-S-isoprenylcysteine O-methyltransferase Ste14